MPPRRDRCSELPRPRHCRDATEQRDEVAPFHSIISSAGRQRLDLNAGASGAQHSTRRPETAAEGSQNDRKNLASKIGIYGPHRRAAWVVPDKRNATNQCEANRRENSIRKLSPVRCLHSWKIFGVD